MRCSFGPQVGETRRRPLELQEVWPQMQTPHKEIGQDPWAFPLNLFCLSIKFES